MTRPSAAHLSIDEIDAWLDGVLSPERHRHIDQCPQCLALVQAERETVDQLAGLPLWGPSAGFADRVMAQVQLPDPFAIRSLAAARRRIVATPRALAASVVLAVALVGSMAGSAVWMAAHQDAVLAWGAALLGQAGDAAWVALRAGASNLIEQPWFASVRDAVGSPARIALVWSAAALAYVAGVLALRRLLTLPTPRVADAHG